MIHENSKGIWHLEIKVNCEPKVVVFNFIWTEYLYESGYISYAHMPLREPMQSRNQGHSIAIQPSIYRSTYFAKRTASSTLSILQIAARCPPITHPSQTQAELPNSASLLLSLVRWRPLLSRYVMVTRSASLHPQSLSHEPHWSHERWRGIRSVTRAFMSTCPTA